MEKSIELEVISDYGIHNRPSIILTRRINEISERYKIAIRVYYKGHECIGELGLMGIPKREVLNVEFEGENINSEIIENFMGGEIGRIVIIRE